MSKSRFGAWITDLDHLLLLVIGICLALAFSLGWNVIQYQTVQNLRTDVRALKKRNDTIEEAALKACQKTKPQNTHFVNGLIIYFGTQADAAHQLLLTTPKTDPQYQARKLSYTNTKWITDFIRRGLPIRCQNDAGS